MRTERIAESQREYMQKLHSGELMRESKAAKRRIENAAPDLLAACKELLKYNSTEVTKVGDYERIDNQMKAAVAKAEGRTA